MQLVGQRSFRDVLEQSSNDSGGSVASVRKRRTVLRVDRFRQNDNVGGNEKNERDE